VKLLTRFYNLFKFRRKARVQNRLPDFLPLEPSAPKNGRLTLAVAGSIILMVLLGIVNIRLIRDPSIAGKAFRPILVTKTQPKANPPEFEINSSIEKKNCPSVPEVTFYRNLKAQDEVCLVPSKTDTSIQTDSKALDTNENRHFETGHSDKREGIKKEAVHTVNSSTQNQQASIPQPLSGRKTYTVQVGAFAHPAIAQEWATKWKSRGYDVSLKPVARPKTGVIYRLYLGKFESEQQADELVKYLQSKEGISAFRLIVRD